MDSIVALDQHFFLFLNNLGNTTWDSFWLFITGNYGSVLGYVFILFWTYRMFGLKGILVIILVVAVMITITDQTTNLVKNILVKRLRPCHNESVLLYMRLVKAHCGGLHGYFSAHASNSFVLAMFFTLLFNKRYISWVLFSWAFLVAYSRIYIGVHYPLDIISGAFFGMFVGWLVYKLSVRFLKRVL